MCVVQIVVAHFVGLELTTSRCRRLGMGAAVLGVKGGVAGVDTVGSLDWLVY